MPDVGPSSRQKGAAREGELAEAATVYALRPPTADGKPAPRRPATTADPAGKRFAALCATGLITITLVIALAIALRSTATIDALEQTASETPATVDAGTIDAAPQPIASATAAPKPPPARVSAGELDEARLKGISALAALAEKYGEDPSVLKALLLAYTRDKQNYAKAVVSARKLLEIAPDKGTDPDVGRALLMLASGPVEIATSAMDMMSNSMGTRGPDLLYELLIAGNVGKFPKERAASLLKDPAVQKLATPELVIANELRAAIPCDRVPLLPRAAKEGDERALAQLKPLLAKKGCKWHRQGDCFECFGDRKELQATIDAITQRISKGSKP